MSGFSLGSFSTAQKIHVSQCTADILLQTTTFELEERGEIKIKVSGGLPRRNTPAELVSHAPVPFREKAPRKLTGC